MKNILFIFAMTLVIANSASAQIKFDQIYEKVEFKKDSTATPAVIYGTYVVKKVSDNTYQFNTSISIASSTRTYSAKGSNADNGLKPTKLTRTLFAIDGVSKVKIGGKSVTVTVDDPKKLDAVASAIKDTAYLSAVKHSPSGEASH